MSDRCVDSDDEVQRVFIEKLFPRQADVLWLDESERRLRGVRA